MQPRAAALVIALLAPTMAHAECRLWRIERDGDELRLVSQALADGTGEALVPDGRPLVSVVIATGEGQSADRVSPASVGRLLARCRDGTLQVLVQRDADEPREVMKATQADLARWRIGVHVTAADGTGTRWAIDRWAVATREAGPVLDLFGNRIPMPPDGHTIVTIVEAAAGTSGPLPASGSADVDWSTGYPLLALRSPDGWRAVLDLAAATTVVRRDALPPGSRTRDAAMREVSPSGIEQRALGIDAAGGGVTGFQAATIPLLAFGDLALHDVEVLALDTLPTIDGAPLDAILGLDLLRPAGRVRLERVARGWRLAWGSDLPALRAAPDVSLPLRSAGALFGIDARVDGVDAFLVLDTGSPHTVLSSGAAHEAALDTRPVDGVPPRGLDGRPLPMRSARVDHFMLGAHDAGPREVRVADLPVLEKLGTRQVGLLGGDVLAGFAAIELDFARKTLRLWRADEAASVRTVSGDDG